VAERLFAGRFQEMDSRLIVIGEKLVSRIHNVELIGDKGVLHQVQGGDHGILRRGCCNPDRNAICLHYQLRPATTFHILIRLLFICPDLACFATIISRLSFMI